MTEQLVFHHRYDGEKETGLSWPRIAGIAFVIALHLAALMMLLIPAVAPKAAAEKERNVMVTLVDAPPPPPPPPPPPAHGKPFPATVTCCLSLVRAEVSSINRSGYRMFEGRLPTARIFPLGSASHSIGSQRETR